MSNVSRGEVIAGAAAVALPAPSPYRVWTKPSWKHAPATAEHYLECEEALWKEDIID
jgi:hypothetical protein